MKIHRFYPRKIILASKENIEKPHLEHYYCFKILSLLKHSTGSRDDSNRLKQE